ncbi:MAG: DCC1-like thiol-disulfide oxidoreductase family protein [Micavibrio sp.]|nr:DCC1-like thiol-disulfide oxidoreductase family protein [Micavibrio sp.]
MKNTANTKPATADAATPPRVIEVLYDGECPMCRTYCESVQLKNPGDKLVLVDARHSSLLLDEVTARGLDIDEGMVVKVNGVMHYGSDAMRALVRFKKSPFYERCLYRSRRVAKVLYATLKFMRNIVLHVLRIEKIRNLGIG